MGTLLTYTEKYTSDKNVSKQLKLFSFLCISQIEFYVALLDVTMHGPRPHTSTASLQNLLGD